jgi:hypothetical protein
MIILDLPQWLVYITWFICANIGMAFSLILWMWALNKWDMRKEKTNELKRNR